VALDSAPVANNHTLLYLGKWSYKAVVTQVAPIQITGLHDDHLVTHLHILYA
jgi:hypothetical protein